MNQESPVFRSPWSGELVVLGGFGVVSMISGFFGNFEMFEVF